MRARLGLGLGVIFVVSGALAACGEDGGGGGAEPRDDAAAGSSGNAGNGGTGAGGTSSGGTSAGGTSSGGTSGDGGAGTSGSAGTAGTSGTGGSGGARPEGWDPDFGLPGVYGPTQSAVNAIVIGQNRRVFVGGAFDGAGGIASPNIALWNGQRWAAAGAGLPREVRELATSNGERVWAVTPGSGPEDELHVFENDAWTNLDIKTDGRIDALHAAADGKLYVIGSFTTIGGVLADRIAVLDGTTWAPIADLPKDTRLDALARVGTDLCAGGASDQGTALVTCFDGARWTARDAGFDFGNVATLTVDASGTLYAGGDFYLQGSQDGGGVAKWTGSKWELVGGGVAAGFGQPRVTSVLTYGSFVYVGGLIQLAGGVVVKHVARWDGRRWNDMNGGVLKFLGVDFLETPRIRAMALDEGGELYAGGRLSFAGTRNALRIARWDGSDWQAVDAPNAVRNGINGQGQPIFVASTGDVYVGGLGFQYVGGDVAANDVARFDPRTGRWSPMAQGLNGVLTFAERDGEIYAGGHFQESGTTPLRHLARWTGTQWRSVSGGTDGSVHGFAAAPNGDLVMVGDFSTAGGVAARRVTVWNGETFSGLGTGVGAADTDTVRTAVYVTDGQLVVGGRFTEAGGVPAANVARWTGTVWEALGDGLDDLVNEVTVYRGQVVVGGTFQASGATKIAGLATWNGSAWEELAGGLRQDADSSRVYVTGLAARGDDLYVAGLFAKAGDQAARFVARWNGTTWSTLDGGVDDTADGLALGSDSAWVTGSFTRAGTLGSVGIARWWFGP